MSNLSDLALIRIIKFLATSHNSPTLRDAADRLDHYRKDRLQNKIKCAAPGWMKGKVMP